MNTNKIKLYWQMIKSNPKNIWWWIQGETRMLLYKHVPFMLRSHIKEQFEYRLDVVDEDCLLQKSCKVCTCSLPSLLFADKPCSKIKMTPTTRTTLFGHDGICYNKMLNKKEWKQLISKY